MPLNIGLVTGEFPPMEGGVGAYTQELAKGLTEGGHKVHIITSIKARPGERERSFWHPQKPVELGYALVHPLINRWWWSALSKIAGIAADYDLDVVNLQYQAAAYSMRVPAINFLPWRLRDLTKTVVTFHDLRHPYLFPKAGRLRSGVVKNLAQSAEGVIVTNGEDFSALSKLGLDETRLVEIPIGSNVKSTIPPSKTVSTLRNELGMKADHSLLGYFGFVNSSKGADLVVEALNHLPEEVHLIFIGAQTGSSDPKNNDTFRNQLLSSIEEQGLGKRVHWTGFLSDHDVSVAMHAVDLMVMPYRDGISLRRGTLMATLAHGRPLVSTKPTSPIPELIDGQNVWLITVDEAEALTEAIRVLLAQPELRRQIGNGALEVATLFTWDKIAQRTISFYNKIVAE